MPKLKWSDSYNCHRLTLGGGIVELGVSWRENQARNPGYEVTVLGHTVGTAIDLQEGKRIAYAALRRLLSDVEAQLDEIDKESM